MSTIGAEMPRVAPGEVTIDLPVRDGLAQQNGHLHAGVATAIADSACGYAAQTVMPAGKDVLTVEFKLNLLAPAAGDVCRQLSGNWVRPSIHQLRTEGPTSDEQLCHAEVFSADSLPSSPDSTEVWVGKLVPAPLLRRCICAMLIRLRLGHPERLSIRNACPFESLSPPVPIPKYDRSSSS